MVLVFSVLIVRAQLQQPQLRRYKATKTLDPLRMKTGIIWLSKQPMHPTVLFKGEGDIEGKVERGGNKNNDQYQWLYRRLELNATNSSVWRLWNRLQLGCVLEVSLMNLTYWSSLGGNLSKDAPCRTPLMFTLKSSQLTSTPAVQSASQSWTWQHLASALPRIS